MLLDVKNFHKMMLFQWVLTAHQRAVSVCRVTSWIAACHVTTRPGDYRCIWFRFGSGSGWISDVFVDLARSYIKGSGLDIWPDFIYDASRSDSQWGYVFKWFHNTDHAMSFTTICMWIFASDKKWNRTQSLLMITGTQCTADTRHASEPAGYPVAYCGWDPKSVDLRIGTFWIRCTLTVDMFACLVVAATWGSMTCTTCTRSTTSWSWTTTDWSVTVSGRMMDSWWAWPVGVAVSASTWLSCQSSVLRTGHALLILPHCRRLLYMMLLYRYNYYTVSQKKPPRHFQP